MNIILCLFLGLTAAICLLALIGACLPRTHRATRSAVFHHTSEELFGAIHDFAAMPSWRSALTGVEILPPREGHASFRELTARRAIPYVVIEDRPPSRLVTQIADDKLPFGGTWTYEVTSEAGGARLRITEDGEIRNLLFRSLARLVFGYTGTMDAYLRDLGRKFGETVEPAP
jgi:hypothetical protein